MPDPMRARTCRVCGCTDNDACEPEEYWVQADLCSACLPEGACVYCGAIDCTRMGGLVLCSQPVVSV